MRVQVYGGNGVKDLGRGTFNERVNVYLFWMPDGSIKSLSDCEKEPTTEEKEAIEAEGGILEVAEDNPKIVLDTGEVKYGCQVWWCRYDGDDC